MAENPLPAFSTTINLLSHKNDQSDMKKHDYLSFSFSSLQSRHSVLYNHVKKCLFYKRIMQSFSRAFEYALVLWIALWTSSIRLRLCKVRRMFLIFEPWPCRALGPMVTVTQSQKLRSIRHLRKPPTEYVLTPDHYVFVCQCILYVYTYMNTY